MIHIGTLLDHLGGVGTSMDRVSAPNMGQVEQIHGGVGKSISQHLLGPHAPTCFWRFLQHIGTLLETWKVLTHSWAEHWPPKMGQVEQTHGGMGKSISQHLLGPHAPNFFEVPGTHRNTFRPLGRC